MSTLNRSSQDANDVPIGASGEPSEPPRDASRHWVRWVAAFVVAVAGLTAYLLANRVPQAQRKLALEAVDTARVQLGAVDQVLRLTGQTSARRYASVSMPRLRGGRMTLTLTQLVTGGTAVKKGDIVAALNTEEMIAEVEDANEDMDRAQADLKRRQAQQQAEMESLQQSLRLYKSAMDKAIQEARSSEVQTTIQQELLTLQVDQTTTQYKQAQQSEALKEDSIAADTVIAEINYKREQRNHDRHATDLGHATFFAPLDGLAVVQTLNRGGSNQVQYQVGDDINPGRDFLRIVDLSSMQLEATASQVESRSLRVGQPATVELDAFKGVSFPASIYSVGAMASAGTFGSYYVRTVPVKVQIQGADPRLIPDMSGAATIKLEHKENVLTVPLEALHSETGRIYVYVRTAKGFAKQEVGIGLRSATSAEVISGLTAGQQVALTTPPATAK